MSERPEAKTAKRKRWWKPLVMLFVPERVVSVVPLTYGDVHIVTNKAEYRGQCTCWSHYPSGWRCGTVKCSWLFSVWRSHEWSSQSTACAAVAREDRGIEAPAFEYALESEDGRQDAAPTGEAEDGRRRAAPTDGMVTP